MKICEQLKTYRKKMNLSQDDLAEIVYVSRQRFQIGKRVNRILI